MIGISCSDPAWAAQAAPAASTEAAARARKSRRSIICASRSIFYPGETPGQPQRVGAGLGDIFEKLRRFLGMGGARRDRRSTVDPGMQLGRQGTRIAQF